MISFSQIFKVNIYIFVIRTQSSERRWTDGNNSAVLLKAASTEMEEWLFQNSHDTYTELTSIWHQNNCVNVLFPLFAFTGPRSRWEKLCSEPHTLGSPATAMYNRNVLTYDTKDPLPLLASLRSQESASLFSSLWPQNGAWIPWMISVLHQETGDRHCFRLPRKV